MNITAGLFKGRKIIVPDEKITRPTLSKVRMSVFNTLQTMTEFEGKSFLDMYSGSGIMGLEALSRGFTKVIAIEKNSHAFNVIKENFSKFKPAPQLIKGDSLKICPKLNEEIDVIYIDPPYFAGIYEQSLNAISRLAFGIVILEHVTDVDFAGYEILKQKSYGGKIITFLKKEENSDK